MEAYDDKERQYADKMTNVYERWDGFKTFISTFLGIIIAFVGIALVFIISSLEPTKEIKAPNKVNALLIEEWRSKHPTELFPEEKVDLIYYKGEEYYFVIKEKNELGEIEEWYFAYDGGIGYVLHSTTFYILTAFTIIISVTVSQTNYTTSINSTMNSTKFVKTLMTYQKSKERIADYTQYLGEFCRYKNQQAYESKKRSIVESADISYSYYNSKDFDYDSLADWQKKKLDKIRKIKVKRITPSDLLQEGRIKGYVVSLLPTAPEESKRNFFIRNIVQKIISSFLSGLTVVFGFVLGEWVLGITYSFVVFMSFITANVLGNDYANNTLRQRYIAKSDLLNEFYNIKGDFILEHKQVELKDDTKTHSIFGDVGGLKNKQEESIDNPSKTLIREIEAEDLDENGNPIPATVIKDNENYNKLLHEEVKANG